MGGTLALSELLCSELLLFAALGLIIGGLDDLAIDLIYLARRGWRSLTVYSRVARMTSRDLPPAGSAGPIAVFIPAWDESDVIRPMLTGCLDKWAGEDVQIFVGAYPNDPATLWAVCTLITERGGGRVTLVVNDRPGPTTKADCLNQLWVAMQRWEAEQGRRVLTVVLHDAEDVVHPDALRVIGYLAPRFALVQLPVLPLKSARSQWVAGHYLDEFAVAHGASLTVREALGAAMPSAGVGCGFSRDALAAVAMERGGRPFDEASLTEDYELGLRIGDAGGRGILVRMRDARGELIATREYFPDSWGAAVRQKARWTVGIALAGWDRLGWSGPWRERWMRLRDRRAALAAIVLVAAYAGLGLALFIHITRSLMGLPPMIWPEPLPWLMRATAVLLAWRLIMRMIFVWRAYGWAQALLSVPRTITGNIVAILAAGRAISIYVRHLRGRALVWDKTRHRFPDAATGASA
ncbi:MULTISPECIES: glycosyl transferase family protein [unclassified Sphingobium]|uniref:glycosyl transferase family protein n=1 Tax=unclassified Sphingobium TaxID=2611147 RepID=UPI002224514C|nr:MULTISPECIES: glycosyl transferase family protein [unclassified Sphingobium]MCW2395365.1 adsorption protein B [Sphingobium sp. B8D3B]MCW2418880.1 adsorption protein B [Sphingobium sp. B8D3C]